jgi:hypothetical protein
MHGATQEFLRRAPDGRCERIAECKNKGSREAALDEDF